MNKINFSILILIFIIIIGEMSVLNSTNDEYENIDYNGYVVTQNLRIRKKPSATAQCVGFYKIGTYISCLQRTKKRDTIGEFSNYWYNCMTEPHDATGWVFGHFINQENFNEQKYLNTLSKPIINGDDKYILKNTNWINCSPNLHCDYGTIYYSFTDRTISFGSDIWKKTYQIKKINTNNETIIIIGQLIFSMKDVSIEEKDEIVEIKINIQNISEGKIKIGST